MPTTFTILSTRVTAFFSMQVLASARCTTAELTLSWPEKQGIRYVFHQDIVRKGDEKLCCRATVELVCLINGRLGNSEEYDRAFEKFYTKENED